MRSDELTVWCSFPSTFALAYTLDDEMLEPIYSFIRLFVDQEAWEKARDKGKVPKAKIEATTTGLRVLHVFLKLSLIHI